MPSLAAALVLAAMIAQPPAPPAVPAPSTATPPATKPATPAVQPPTPAPTAMPPAPVASAAAAGPWVVGEAKYYRVDESADEVVTSPANPGHKTDRKSLGAYVVKIVPKSLDAAKPVFELTVVELKLNVPTPPMGEMKIDSTLPEDPKDQLSFHFGRMLKKMIGVPVTVSLEGGMIKEVTGNEALTDPKTPGAAPLAVFFGDAAISERFVYCLQTGAGATKIEQGATWPVGAKVSYRKLMVIDLPASATVKGIKDGLATIVIAPGEGAKMVAAKGAEEMLGKTEGTVKENLYAGELVWNTQENRLLSAAYTTGYAVAIDIGGMQGEQRSARSIKIVRVDAPAAK